MRAVDLIREKRDGAALSQSALRDFATGAASGSWPDYQLAAMLMAIMLRGMTLDETADLTAAMVESGRRLDLTEFGRVAVDKHSTGGVGDKTSLVIAPLAAACGVIVPMMAGRGLGFTGGTLDKLESISGFRTRLAEPEVRRSLRTIGCVIVGPSDDVAPADRRLYALRDATATVESLPLITASILSKKIAEGVSGIVFDVKAGSGAFMTTLERARELAAWLVHVATARGIRALALLTPMDTPLGRSVGNAVEVIEAIETLKGHGPHDLEDLCVRLTVPMLVLAGLAEGGADAEIRVRRALASGEALDRFRAMIGAQGGDAAVVDDYARLPQADAEFVFTAPRRGFVRRIDAGLTGRIAVALGAGRDRVDADIDHSAAIRIQAPVGSAVGEGDAVIRLAARDRTRLQAAAALLAAAVEIDDVPPLPAPAVLDVVGRSGER